MFVEAGNIDCAFSYAEEKNSGGQRIYNISTKLNLGNCILSALKEMEPGWRFPYFFTNRICPKFNPSWLEMQESL